MFTRATPVNFGLRERSYRFATNGSHDALKPRKSSPTQKKSLPQTIERLFQFLQRCVDES